jgi:hypothetical protein
MRIEQQTLARPIKLKMLKRMSCIFLKTSGSESNRTALSVVLNDALAEADALAELSDPHNNEKQDPKHRNPNPWMTSL